MKYSYQNQNKPEPYQTSSSYYHLHTKKTSEHVGEYDKAISQIQNMGNSVRHIL